MRDRVNRVLPLLPKTIDQPTGYVRLAADPSRHAWPMWDPSGQSIIYMSDAGGAENLWRLPLASGAQPQKLTQFTDGRLLYPTIAHDGSAVVFERGMQVWRLDLRSGNAAAVPLTSVRQPRRQLGATAAELLLDEASNPDHQHRQVVFTPELVVRASTRRPT